MFTARGSCAETKFHLSLARDLKYLDEDEYLNAKENIDDVGKQLNGWISSLMKRLALKP